MLIKSIILSFFLFVVGGNALKILCIFPVPGYSHHATGYTLMKELAKRGHNVTFVTPFAPTESVENLRTIVLTGVVESWKEFLEAEALLDLSSQSSLSVIPYIGQIGNVIVDSTLAHENVQKLLHSGEEFDIVFVEKFTYDGLLSIANRFDAIPALISVIGPGTWFNHLVGNPEIPSYMENTYIDPPIHTSFYKRVCNFLLCIFQMFYDHLYMYPTQNRIIKKYFPNSPHIYDIIYKVSLIIFNSDPSFGQPIPKTPTMIEIGGFHVQPPKKLPDDLQKIMDDAPNGVIYFSLGSALQGKFLPEKMREGILRSFPKFKETVLWKYEEDLPDLPSNIIIRKWLPQQDILAHPNLKLFITHGGLQSMIEAVHRGVPIIGIPAFGDQKMNVMQAVGKGHGVIIPHISELSEETLTDALNEALTNPKYAQNIKRSSRLLKDQLVSPIDKVEYWIQYVVRHKGAKHLRVAALDLAWYQHISFDVILFLIVVTVVLFHIFYRIIRWLLGGKKTKKHKLN